MIPQTKFLGVALGISLLGGVLLFVLSTARRAEDLNPPKENYFLSSSITNGMPEILFNSDASELVPVINAEGQMVFKLRNAETVSSYKLAITRFNTSDWFRIQITNENAFSGICYALGKEESIPLTIAFDEVSKEGVARGGLWFYVGDDGKKSNGDISVLAEYDEEAAREALLTMLPRSLKGNLCFQFKDLEGISAHTVEWGRVADGCRTGEWNRVERRYSPVMACDYSQRDVYLYPQRKIIKRIGWSPAFGDEKVACGTKYLKDDESGMWLRCFTRPDLRLMGGESVMFFEERPAASVSNQYSSVAESISAMFQGESYPNGMIINLDEHRRRVRNIRIYGPKSEIIAEWGGPTPLAYGQYEHGVIKVAADFKTDRSGVQCMSVKGKVICRFRTDNDGRIDPRFPIEPGGETKADWFGPRVIFSECGKKVRQLEVYHKGAVVGVWP